MKAKLLMLLSLSCTWSLLSNFSYAYGKENDPAFVGTKLSQDLMLAPYKTAGQKSKTYILPATPATTQWGVFDKNQPPVLKINSGDTVAIETAAASDNQVVPGLSVEKIAQMNDAVSGRGPHTLTGPIYVEGAEPGDVLRIHFNKIMPRAYASNDSLPGKGLLPEKFPVGQVKYFHLDLKNMQMQFAPGIIVPLHPFPGIIAVAQAKSGKIDSIPPGDFGGNMDLPEMVEGTTLYLPVFVKGGLLWTGDSHAGQGNGEIDLTAIETAFSEFNVTIDVIKHKKLDWPLVETPSSWVTVGYDKDLNKAIDILKSQTTDFIMKNRKVSKSQAEKIMYANWNCPISEVVDEVNGTYCIVPKNLDTPKPLPLPKADNTKFYVTYAKNADAMQAMKDASWDMITKISALKHITKLDTYVLLSLTLDCRLAPYTSGDKEVHCMLPKSLWLSGHDTK